MNETRTFDYPNNVMFVNLLPNSNYSWSVSIQGISGSVNGENWTFTTTDKIYPINDRSIDISIQDSTYLPSHIQNLEVSRDNYTFLKFDIPPILDSLSALHLNLTPSMVETVSEGVVLYRFQDLAWSEKLNESNIGLANFESLIPLDTISLIEQNVELTIDIKPFIINGGLYSFALGVIDSGDHVSFYSKENLILEGGFNSTVPNHNSGYATKPELWPSISLQLENNLSSKNNSLPKVFALHQNYPNPFNPKTIIRFDLPKESNVKILIYDILGRLIKKLMDNKQSIGFKSIQWDATNNYGKKVSAGVYLYRIEAGDFRQTKKMVLLK